MKRKVLMTAAMLSAFSLISAPLDKGGVTFDLKKSSSELFKPAREIPQAENLITNADHAFTENPKDPLRWLGNYCFLHTKEIADKDPRRAQVRKMVKWSVKDGVFSVYKPEELKKILPLKVVASTSGAWRKVVNLPNDKGGLYNFSFQYKGKIEGPGGACLIVQAFSEPAGKHWKAKSLFFKVYSIKLSNTYQNYQKAILLPQGTKSLQVVYRIDGVGELHFRKPAVTAATPATTGKKLTLQLSPMGRLDNTFALAQDLPGTIAFIWKRNGTPAEAKLTRPQLVMVLPNEIAFHEAAHLKFLGKREGTGETEYRVDLSGRRTRPAAMADFDNYLRHSALLSTKAAPGTKMLPGKAWVEDGGNRVSNIVSVNFTVIPKFKAAKPQYYLPGFYTGGVYMSYSTPENISLCARMFDAAGVRWIVGSQRSAYPAWRKAGVKVITPELFYVSNGFRVGKPEGRPEADKYRAIGTHNLQEMNRATCPAAVHEKRPYYVKSTIPYINENLKGADGLWANWEPYGYAGRGCFCDTCRKNFAKFVGVSEEQMKKEWPQELAMNRKYHAQAVRFRSLEHAKLMLTIDEAVTAATGGKGKSLGFIPGVQVDNMSSTWRKNGFDKETHPIDYAGKFDWIDPWGPYAFWDAHTPYVYNKSFNLRTYLKAKDVRAAVNKDYPRHIKLLAFPHGMQLQDWVTQPESIAIELLSFMFNRWEGATVYAFPKGYDARFWKAFADASNIAARYDKYVFKGKCADARVELTPQAPYAAKTAVLERLVGTHSYHEMLQYNAYELDGTLIVAAFNFWRDGEVFFTLKVKGLKNNVRYTVRNSDTRFTAKGGKSFTGKELAKGITLHAGAVRCAVYEIAPEKAADKKMASFTADDMLKAQNAARSALLKAKAADTEYEKIYGIKESKIEDIANADINCKADRKNNILSFTSGKNKLELYLPTFCANLWTVDGKAIVHGNKMSGFGCVAFWTPSTQIRNGFTVTEQKKIKGGIEITAEKRMLDRDRSQLAGLIIRQSFKVTDGLRKLEVITTLINSSDRNISFGVRYNLIPAIPGLPGGFTRILAKGKPVAFKRSFARSLFTTGIDKQFETEVRQLFSVKTPNAPIDAAPVSFHAPGIKAQMTLAPANLLAGAAVWDSGRQAAGTFEPCFKFVDLGPGGKSLTISSAMQVAK